MAVIERAEEWISCMKSPGFYHSRSAMMEMSETVIRDLLAEVKRLEDEKNVIPPACSDCNYSSCITGCFAMRGRIAALEAELAEADKNAPWLSLAHTICTDAGIPPGEITHRMEMLRNIFDERRSVAMDCAEIIRKVADKFGSDECLEAEQEIRAKYNL